MSHANIMAALRQGMHTFLTLAEGSGGLGGIATAWPNVDFTPPNTAPYAVVSLLPAGSDPITLGLGGEDEHTGFVQLGLYYPLQAGDGALTLACSKVSDYFVAGMSLAYGGTEVWIERVRMSPPSKQDPRYVAYATIYWRARTSRRTNIL